MKRKHLPISDYPYYNDKVDVLMTKSKVLNSGNERPGAYTEFYDKEGCKTALFQLLGDENGLVKDGVLAVIPRLKKQIAEIKLEFEDYKKRMEDEGKETPQEMDDKMLERLYDYEAFLTVGEAEVEILTKKLKELDKQVNDEEDEKMLMYGLQGQTQLVGGVAIACDFQRVEKVNGVLAITSKRSPYYGLPLIIYKRMCVDYYHQRELQDAIKLDKLRQEAKAQGLPLPVQLPSRSNRTIPLSSLPKWPKGVKSVFEIEKESEVERTK